MAVVELKSGTGAVVQVIGPVVDVEFSGERLPEILDALEIDREFRRHGGLAVHELRHVLLGASEHEGEVGLRDPALL